MPLMPRPRTEPPGGGSCPQLTLRTAAPLPVFSTPLAVPDATATISSFKLSILLILTGAHSGTSRTLTSSEQLKEMTLNQWRLDMMVLELRQNSLIAPETREATLDHGQDPGPSSAIADDIMQGFELQDDHECALLEEGDEIVARLKPQFTLADMRLPDLGPRHKYAAPPASLTRAGTLSAPPPYSVAPPAEPSSHSSSVAAQPNADFHAHRYRDYSGGWRVVTAAHGVTALSNSNGAPATRPKKTPRTASAGVLHAQPVELAATGVATAQDRRPSKPRRASAVPLTTMDRSPPAKDIPMKRERPTKLARPHSSGDLLSTLASQRSPSSSGAPTPTSTSPIPPSTMVAPPPTTTTSAAVAPVTTPSNVPSTSSSPQSPSYELPLTALVIGPGVQGAVGRRASSAASPIGTSGAAAQGGRNATAFVGFTAASGEVQPRAALPKPKRKNSRQSSFDVGSSSREAAALKAALAEGLDGGAPVGGVSKAHRTPGAAAAEAAERRIAAAREREMAHTLTDKAPTSAGAAIAAAQADQGRRSEDALVHASAAAHARMSAWGSGSTQPGGSGSRPLMVSPETAPQTRPNRVELPVAPILPPIQNLAPFPSPGMLQERQETLAPMPTAVGAPVVSSPRQLTQDNGQNGLDKNAGVYQRTSSYEGAQLRAKEDAAGEGSKDRRKRSDERRPGLSHAASNGMLGTETQGGGGASGFFRRGFSTGLIPKTSQESAQNDAKGDAPTTPGVEGQTDSGDADGSASKQPKQSKADRRYAEIQRSLAKERARQSEAEELRRKEMLEREERKKEEEERKRKEEKERKVKEQWEVWEEIRRREKAAGLPPPKVLPGPEIL